MDQMFRLYLLTLLIDMQVKDNLTVILPSNANVTYVKPD